VGQERGVMRDPAAKRIAGADQGYLHGVPRNVFVENGFQGGLRPP
jgi:hypothetical protein